VLYLEKHPEMDAKISKKSFVEYQTTESADTFEENAALFLGRHVQAKSIHLT
jgi:glutamate racemase